MVDDMSDVIKQPLEVSTKDAWLGWLSLAPLETSINTGLRDYFAIFSPWLMYLSVKTDTTVTGISTVYFS